MLVVMLVGVGAAGFAGGIVYDQQVLQSNTDKVSVPAGTAKDFQLIVDAWNVLQKDYVDRSALQTTPLIYGAISGMVDSLGDTGHSRFLSPQMLKSETQAINGSFEGIGAEVQTKDGNTVVVAPIEGSPAEKAGVKAGDVILKVNEEDVTGQPLETVVSKILGPAGTQVTIALQDPTTHVIRSVTITRARITVNNVSWSMLPGTKIADLHLAGFSSGVTQQIKDALTAIQAQGATGLIFDLRNNPGGLLNEAIGVASQFLKEGNVLQEKDAQGNIRSVPIQKGGLATDIPMVVLINQGTASAAEIVSGALQDAGRATLIGETTFGTGTVLSTFNLPDSSALLLATEEWLTPKGHSIWHHGITPDQVVTLDPNLQPLFPSTIKSMTDAQLQAATDTQLLKGVSVLNAGSTTSTQK